MFAARSTNQISSSSAVLTSHQSRNADNTSPPSNVAMGAIQKPQQHSPDANSQGICTECAECAECAAKQLQSTECNSTRCQEEITSLNVPAMALLPLHTSSPERRITIKEIVAGEERPKYLLSTQYKPLPERRVIRETLEDVATNDLNSTTADELVPPLLPVKPGAASTSNKTNDNQKPPPIPPKESSPTQINGILKGGKLWKNESMSQLDDQNNATSEDEISSTKRSVRFVTEVSNNAENDIQQLSSEVDDFENQINELIPIKKHSTLFSNALRPNSAVRQLFPSVGHCSPALTSETLRAFDESKRAGCFVPNLPGSGDTDTLKRSIERNMLRRSLIKKKTVKSDISLEERIKQLTCDIGEDEETLQENEDEENVIVVKSSEIPQHVSLIVEENSQKILNGDKSFSPCSSVSSSSSGSFAYKKISDIFNREKKQEKILEMEENPIVIIPQECRCPAAPDLGMGTQVPVVHTQIHRTPPRQVEHKRQFLSTLAPLTACVAGNKDDLTSYYTLATAHHSSHSTSHAHLVEYSSGLTGEQSNITLSGEDQRKVAPDVIAGTPGQEQQDELTAFAYQEVSRTEKLKKRYINDNLNVSSDDDEQNDYGFNKRPSVRGIKPKFNSTNEILQQMQEQLTQQMPNVNMQIPSAQTAQYKVSQQQHQQQQQQQEKNIQQQIEMHTNTITQQQAEHRTWSFYPESDDTKQQIPIETNLQQDFYQTLPAGTMFRQTMIQHDQDESLMYSQNSQTMTSIDPTHYGHLVRSPTRRPESPPPLRNYHQTMLLIPCNAETYSQLAPKNLDPKVAHIQRRNILEYQQVKEFTKPINTHNYH
ncbi:uncharacterized protein LOC119666025 [Teleopsis dalmanni]|uniref:uncharacterized protein LOC119666025 n=1 Tax=Teleopsis dalmanni TaxID=139649 RepID=UPI0018CF0286|nr:uncharacterized protein LOC119666025 [Teleopsis dalmanni]